MPIYEYVCEKCGAQSESCKRSATIRGSDAGSVAASSKSLSHAQPFNLKDLAGI